MQRTFPSVNFNEPGAREIPDLACSSASQAEVVLGLASRRSARDLLRLPLPTLTPRECHERFGTAKSVHRFRSHIVPGAD
jgi:hypothetical protein